MDIQETVENLIADSLKLSRDSVSAETSMDNLSAWDSIAQVNILMGIEQSFDLYFDAEEFSELTSVAHIVARVTAG